MKILARVDGLPVRYIAEVDAGELAKVFDKSYYDDAWRKLEPGAVVDLGAGVDFRNQINRVAETAKSACEAFAKNMPALTKALTVLATERLPREGSEV